MYFAANHLFFLAIFSDWKPFNGAEGAKMDAFSAGLDSQGKEIYVGRGTFNSLLSPGRLLLEDNGSKTAGLYIEFSSVERKITSNIEYYVKNPSCDYKWEKLFQTLSKL